MHSAPNARLSRPHCQSVIQSALMFGMQVVRGRESAQQLLNLLSQLQNRNNKSASHKNLAAFFLSFVPRPIPTRDTCF